MKIVVTFRADDRLRHLLATLPPNQRTAFICKALDKAFFASRNCSFEAYMSDQSDAPRSPRRGAREGGGFGVASVGVDRSITAFDFSQTSLGVPRGGKTGSFNGESL